MESFAEDLNISEDQMFSRRGGEEKIPQMAPLNDVNESNEVTEVQQAPVESIDLTQAPMDISTANGNGESNVDGEAPKKPKEKRMSRGAMKRFKALLEKGIPEEEARKQALIIPPPQVKKKKPVPPPMPPKRLGTNSRVDERRGRDSFAMSRYQPSSGRIFYDSHTKQQNYPRNGPMVFRYQFQEFAQKLDPKQIRLEVLPINYPIDLLSPERIKFVEEQIVKKLAEQRNSVIKPGFLSIVHRIGYIYLIAKDRATAYWLKSLFNWTSEGLRVTDVFDHQYTNCIEATFPMSADMSTAAVFNLLQGQNPGIYTENWKIISEIATGTTLNLIIAMDSMSLATLEREKFKLYYKFHHIKFEHCMGLEGDLVMAYKKFNTLNGPMSKIVGQFQGRGTYAGYTPENNRDPVFSSDFFYNRH